MPQGSVPPSVNSTINTPNVLLREINFTRLAPTNANLISYLNLPDSVAIEQADYDAGELQFTTIVSVSINGYQNDPAFGAVLEAPTRSAYGSISRMRGDYVCSYHPINYDALMLRFPSERYLLSRQSAARPRSTALANNPKLLIENSSSVGFSGGLRNPVLPAYLGSVEGAVGGTVAAAFAGTVQMTTTADMRPYDNYGTGAAQLQFKATNADLEINEAFLDGGLQLGDLVLRTEPLRLGLFIKAGLSAAINVQYVKHGVYEEHERLPLYDSGLGGGGGGGAVP